MEFTQQERELLQKLLYNEYLKQNYLLKAEKIKEIPSELTDLINKFVESGEQNEN